MPRTFNVNLGISNMEFGFAHLPSGPIERSSSLIQEGEANGFDAAWVPDQEFYPDPYATLAIAALETETIDLGLAVTNPFTRHPAITARAAGTVGQIAENRFTLGLGSGNLGEVIKPLGYEPSGVPRRCRETIEIVRRLLDGEDVTYDGKYYTLDDVNLDFAVDSDVPIYVAARGPTMLQMAGEFADGVLVHAVSDASFAYVREYLEKGANRAGRDVDSIDLVSWGPCILDDEYRGEFDSMYHLFTHQIGSASRQMLEQLGMESDKIQEIKDYYSNGEVDLLRDFLDPEDFDHFIVRGDVETCIQELERIQASGIDQFSVLYFGDTLSDTRHNVDVFTHEIIPAFR